MRNFTKRMWLLSLVGGGMLMQMPGCSDAFLFISGLSSAVTAGGVIYLISRVLE